MSDKGKSRISPKTRRGEVVRGDIGTEAPGVAAAGADGTRPDDWAVRNRRRIALIAKQFSQGLTPDEVGELGQLQAEADRYLDKAAPLPFEHLQKLEDLVGLSEAVPAGSNSDPSGA